MNIFSRIGGHRLLSPEFVVSVFERSFAARTSERKDTSSDVSLEGIEKSESDHEEDVDEDGKEFPHQEDEKRLRETSDLSKENLMDWQKRRNRLNDKLEEEAKQADPLEWEKNGADTNRRRFTTGWFDGTIKLDEFRLNASMLTAIQCLTEPDNWLKIWPEHENGTVTVHSATAFSVQSSEHAEDVADLHIYNFGRTNKWRNSGLKYMAKLGWIHNPTVTIKVVFSFIEQEGQSGCVVTRRVKTSKAGGLMNSMLRSFMLDMFEKENQNIIGLMRNGTCGDRSY